MSALAAGAGHRIVLSGYADVRDAFRQHDLRQALYDAGGAVMADSLITLHGDAHKQRRRVENRLFRRGTFRWWERNLVPGTIEQSFAGPLAAGSADLVQLGRRTIMYLTAMVAGIDPPATDAAAEELEQLARVFSAGATAVHSTRDPAELNAEVAAAMAAFDAHFLAPALARRTALIAAVAAGRRPEDELPRDVLTAALRYQEQLNLDRDMIRREIAFYLQAGSHSTANLFTHASHQVFQRLDDPEFAARTKDRAFLQRCVLETLRLHPASPVAWRRALAPIELRSGIVLPEGALVELDLQAANTDPQVWGPDADRFDPDRTLPEGIPPWGHSFGGGTHACIGMELDGGVHSSGDPADEHEPVFGTVTLMVHALLENGARPDPAQAPTPDPHSSRENFSRYPVVFGRR
ncbi:MAG TPA: cytochrome P450 [Streptosporangiaceae bacterium]|jgi:cytochrome P450|nr:cytochrome P450 [Streptosporangiaceae bacterium]